MEGDRSRFESANTVRTAMQTLATSAIATVQKAEMFDEANQRLFKREPAVLLEPSESGVEYRFRPMVELLLHELVAIGGYESLDTAERQHRIRWALDMAGF